MVLLKRLSDKLVGNGNAIDTSKLIKILTDHHSKIKDIEDKLPSITCLATTAALSAVENIIPNISD